MQLVSSQSIEEALRARVAKLEKLLSERGIDAARWQERAFQAEREADEFFERLEKAEAVARKVTQ